MMTGYARGARPAPLAAAGAGADAAPLVATGCTWSRRSRRRSRARSIEGLRTRSSCATTVARQLFPEIAAARLPRGRAARARAARRRRRSRPTWSDALLVEPGRSADRAAGEPRRDDPRAPRAARRGDSRSASSRAFSRLGGRARLALHELGLAGARRPRPAGGRRRHAPRPARSGRAARRRRARLLARRGGRAAGCCACAPR